MLGCQWLAVGVRRDVARVGELGGELDARIEEVGTQVEDDVLNELRKIENVSSVHNLRL